MEKNQILDIQPAVKAALDAGSAVVALESTIISHGMPYPQNIQMARKVESIIRSAGAVPATVAIMDGKIKIGLSDRSNASNSAPTPLNFCSRSWSSSRKITSSMAT